MIAQKRHEHGSVEVVIAGLPCAGEISHTELITLCVPFATVYVLSLIGMFEAHASSVQTTLRACVLCCLPWCQDGRGPLQSAPVHKGTAVAPVQKHAPQLLLASL